MTGTAIPQLGLGGDLQGALGDAITGGERISLLAKLDGLYEEPGFALYVEVRHRRVLHHDGADGRHRRATPRDRPLHCHVCAMRYLPAALLFNVILYTSAPAAAPARST